MFQCPAYGGASRSRRIAWWKVETFWPLRTELYVSHNPTFVKPFLLSIQTYGGGYVLRNMKQEDSAGGFKPEWSCSVEWECVFSNIVVPLRDRKRNWFVSCALNHSAKVIIILHYNYSSQWGAMGIVDTSNSQISGEIKVHLTPPLHPKTASYATENC